MAASAFGLKIRRGIGGQPQFVGVRSERKQQNEQQEFFHVSVLR
jgi:hypothetical protein